MWVHQNYEIGLIIQTLHSIEKNNCSFLAVTKYVQSNQRNNEWEWWSTKVSALKIWNESNHTKIACNWKKNCSPLDVTNDVKFNCSKKEQEWCSMKVGTSEIWNELNHKKIALDFKILLLPLWYRQCNIVSMKHWMKVI